jgi:integrase
VAVWSGLRENELLGLTWADLDLKDKKIHVRKQLSRPTNDRPAERVSIKTGTTRSVDIDPELVAFLREYKERALARGHARPEGYVFCADSGRPLHFRNLGKAFTKAADKAKLNTDERRKLRFHDLRRTFASILIEGGLRRPVRCSTARPLRGSPVLNLRRPSQRTLSVREGTSSDPEGTGPSLTSVF